MNLVRPDEKIIIGNARILGNNHTFRKFTELNDIIVFMQDFEERFNMDPNDIYGSVAGIMHQFMCFDIPVKQRERDEVIIYFMEDDPKTPTKPRIEINTLWLNKKTRKVINPPGWFNEKKKIEIGKWN